MFFSSGTSDIMRGATNPHETATAQRIKGTMGVGRTNDQKGNVENFVRDLLRLKAEIIAKNFDAQTLTQMTGEEVTPEVLAQCEELGATLAVGIAAGAL